MNPIQTKKNIDFILLKSLIFTGLIIVQSAIVSVIDLNLSQTTIKSGNGYKWSAWSNDQ